jgi:hypothetical protein
MKNELRLLEATTSTFQELLSPLITLTSAYALLKGKTPPDIEQNISVIGEFSEKLKREVKNIYHSTGKEFNLLSPSKAASQIRQLASGWKRQTTTLSTDIHKIQTLRESGHKLDNPELDAILDENLINDFMQLVLLLNYLETIEEKDLIAWRYTPPS